MIECLKAENGSAIVNANIVDGEISAGIIIALPLSPAEMIFSGEFHDYLVRLPEELTNQGLVSSMVDVNLPFTVAGSIF